MRRLSVLGLVLVASCLFNPQPDPPGNNLPSDGETGSTTTDGAGPSTSVGANAT